MNIRCTNGNTVERFWDRRTRSSVTRVLDARGNQIGDASYDGNKTTADFVLRMMVRDNGGRDNVRSQL